MIHYTKINPKLCCDVRSLRQALVKYYAVYKLISREDSTRLAVNKQHGQNAAMTTLLSKRYVCAFAHRSLETEALCH